jgi:hypothetical protein
MNKSGRFFLLILPFAYLFLGFYFNQIIGLFSMRNVDPEYVYLTNGLYMSLGHMNVQHIDNPGTPLQMMVAVVCRVVYFIRAPHIPYIEDVMMNSDLYLNIINHVVIALTSIILYISGVIIWRITSLLPYGLLIQTLPFYSNLTYDIIGRLTPELLLPIPALLLSIMIIKTVKSKSDKLDFKTILLYGMISGFGLSIKFTYFPLLIIPLFLIPGYKDKLKYILLSLLSLFVFAIPILYNLSFIIQWIRDILIHSGHYGKGSPNVLLWNPFLHHLVTFYKFHVFLTFTWLMGFILLLIYLIYNKKEVNHRLLYGMTGVLIAMLVQIIIVAKHYEYRYLVPGLTLFPILIILSFEILKNTLRLKWMNIITGFIILAGTSYCLPRQIQSIHIRSRGIFTEMKNKMVTKHYVETLPADAIKLLTPSEYGCPFHDFSIMISHCWAGRENKVFMPVYKKLYPATYQYFKWEGRNKYWNDNYDISDITCSTHPVYFFIANYSPELDTVSLDALLPAYPVEKIKQQLVFDNPVTNEKIFRLTFPEEPGDTSCIKGQ